MMEVLFGFSLIIMMAALPTIVPAAAVLLPLQGIYLIARGNPVGAGVCFGLAGYLILLMVGPAERVPGAHFYRELSGAEEQRQQGLRTMTKFIDAEQTRRDENKR